jgi:hypothetical protein
MAYNIIVDLVSNQFLNIFLLYMYAVPMGGSVPNQNINVGTNLNFTNVSIANASIATATVGTLRANIFSQNILNVSQINASELNLPDDYIIPFLNVSQLIAFSESFVDLSATNISSSNITATSVTAPNVQETLIAGSNIDICGNVISSTGVLPSIGNFTEINTSQINASNLSTADLSIGTNLTLTNKLLNVNSTVNVTQNSGDLITSGGVYSALNGAGGGDSRSLTNTQLYLGGDVIKPIVPGTVKTVNVNIPPGSTRNMMKVFYTTKFGANAILNCTASFSYEMSGYNGDTVNARLIYNNGVDNTISRQEQIWRDHNGGGTRSGVLSPRIGNQTSAVSAGTTVYFQVLIDNNSSDDTWTMLFPDSCTFQITETLDNDGGSDLNLNTGNLQADEANFNSLSILEGSPAGQAVIGRTQIGNDGHSDRMAISINGNTGATDYGFAQVASGQTIMNAQSTSTSNSFRVEDVEVASINYIGLAIGYEEAFFPLSISGDAFINGTAFISVMRSEVASAANLSSIDVSLVNLSATKSSIDNLSVGNITITGNITANALNLSTGNLVPGDNITIENNVISAYLSSDSQANLSSLQVDNNVDVFGVLNVSQTSNFQDSLNVSNNLYVGKSGQHAGDIVLYSGVVGNNFVQSFNSSGYEVNISVTGNSSAINFFVGNQPCLEIRNNGIETLNLKADDINAETLNVVELEADIFECIDGEATFRFSTPLLNATTANISTLTIDELDLDELDITKINAFRGNFSFAVANVLTASTCILSDITANDITSQTIESTNITATSNFATPNANFSSINSSISRSRSVNTFSFNLSDETSSAQSMTMNRDGGAVNIVNNAGSIIFNTNTNSTARVLIMDSNNLIQTRSIQNAGSFESRNISTDENVSVGGSLSVGGSIEGYQEALIAGTNISIVGNTISSSPPSNANFSTITSQTTNTSFLNTSFITCDELDTDQVYTVNLSSSALDAINISTDTIAAFQYTIIDTANDAEASFLFRNGRTTRFIHAGGRLRFECDELQTAGVANFSTLNASVVNGANLSTATMVFTSDFNLQSFGNVLSLTKPLLSVDEVVAGLASKDVVTESLNTSSLNVDGITSLDLVSVSIGLSSTNNNLFNINSGGTANISQGNFSTINASNIVGYQETLLAGDNITIDGNTISTSTNANFSSVTAEFINSSNVVNVSEIIGSNCDFGSGYIQSFESELINASNINLSDELNASVVNVSEINASNIVGYQQTLIAGTNISIGGNTISTTADANFSTVNSSNLNALILFVEGYVSIGGIISAPLQPCFKLKCDNTTVSSVNTNINYDGIVIDNHSGYDVDARHYVIPVAGNWFIYYGFLSNNAPFSVELQQNSTQRDRCQLSNMNPTLSDPAVGSNVFNSVAAKGNVILPCVVGDIIRIRVTSGTARTGQVAEFSSFGGFMIG